MVLFLLHLSNNTPIATQGFFNSWLPPSLGQRLLSFPSFELSITLSSQSLLLPSSFTKTTSIDDLFRQSIFLTVIRTSSYLQVTIATIKTSPMPKTFHPKRAICLGGLYFGPGQPFSSQQRAEKIYHLLLGPDYGYSQGEGNMQQRRSRASSILSIIFSVCLGRVETFPSLRNSELGWQIVAGDLAENHGSNLAGPEVEELVRVFTAARTAHIDRSQSRERPCDSFASDYSDLAKLIDQWLSTIGHDGRPVVSGQVPNQHSQELIIRPAPAQLAICRTGWPTGNLSPLTLKTGPPGTSAQPTSNCSSIPGSTTVLGASPGKTKVRCPSSPTRRPTRSGCGSLSAGWA